MDVVLARIDHALQLAAEVPDIRDRGVVCTDDSGGDDGAADCRFHLGRVPHYGALRFELLFTGIS